MSLSRPARTFYNCITTAKVLRYVALSNMSGYFYPCVLNYCDSVSQYFGIITTPY